MSEESQWDRVAKRIESQYDAVKQQLPQKPDNHPLHAAYSYVSLAGLSREARKEGLDGALIQYDDMKPEDQVGQALREDVDALVASLLEALALLT